jgi:dihydroflavonol-4-reductase
MILVTGGTGLLGAHLLYELSQGSEPVRATYRSEERIKTTKRIFSYYSKTPDILFERIQWCLAEMTDPLSILTALEGVKQVYHTAANVSFDPFRRKHILHTNVFGTETIVNQCLKQGAVKLCFVSSTAALGEAPEGEKITEDCIWKGNQCQSVYAVSKFRSEMEVWRGIAEGLNAVIVNPSIIIGPGDWGRSSSNIFLRLWKGLRFYTDGITGYVDVRDVVKIMTGLMNSEIQGDRFIISSGNLSYREVFTAVAEALGGKPPSIHASRSLTEVAWRLDWLRALTTGRERQLSREMTRAGNRKVYFSNDKIVGLTGFRFKPVEQSIQETAKLFLDDVADGVI